MAFSTSPGPRRVLIAGSGGAGKTTLARRLGPALGLPVHELDMLYYGPDLRMSATFPAEIERIAAEQSWLAGIEAAHRGSAQQDRPDPEWPGG